MHKSSCILLVFTLLLYGEVSGSDRVREVVLDDPSTSYAIGKNLLLLKDTSRTLSFEEVLKMKGRFIENDEEVPNFGAGATVIWSAFTVRNTTDEPFYLEIETPYLNEIDLYSIDEEEKAEQQRVGLDRPFDERPVHVTSYLLPLNIDPGERKTFYLRVESVSTLKLVLQIATLKKFYEINQKKDLAHSIYFGLIIALSIYNLFVFFALRDRTYLFYVLYITLTALVIGWLRGFTHEFLLRDSPNINEGNYFAALTFIFFALFSTHFLRLEKYAPHLKNLAWVFYLVASVTILLTLFRERVLGFYGVIFMVNTIIPFVLVIGIAALRKGFSPARYYLLGFFIFTVGDVAFVLKDLALLPRNLVTEYSFEIGSALEAIILSFALANKLNTFKKEKEISQAKAIHQANEFSKQLIESQETERQFIAGELQDSIGQSLSALKNKISLLKKGSSTPAKIDDINEVIVHTIEEVRNISYGLRPYQLNLLGLSHALRSLVDEVSDASGIHLTSTIDSIDGLLGREAEINLYRIVQECLNNMIKHANAKQGIVTISHREQAIVIVIEDDGIGFTHEQEGKGLGLTGIRERVQILGGNVNVISSLYKGTVIEIQIPAKTTIRMDKNEMARPLEKFV